MTPLAWLTAVAAFFWGFALGRLSVRQPESQELDAAERRAEQ